MADITSFEEVHRSNKNFRKAEVLVLVPTYKELEKIQPALSDLLGESFAKEACGGQYFDGTRFRTKPQSGGGFVTFSAAIVCGDDMGNVDSATLTGYLHELFRPELFISAGIAGSLDPAKAWIGDVVLPRHVRHASIKKIFRPKQPVKEGLRIGTPGEELENADETEIRRLDGKLFNPSILARIDEDKIRAEIAANSAMERSAFNDASNELIEILAERFRMKGIEVPSTPRCIKGAETFSWDKVLDSRAVYDFLVNSNNITKAAVCVEMESWGFLKMVEKLRVLDEIRLRTVGKTENNESTQYLVVRGISDIVGTKEDTDKIDENSEGIFRKTAMSNVAVVLSHLIKREWQEFEMKLN